MRVLAVSHPCVTDVNQQFYAELESLGHQVQLVVPENFHHEYANEPIAVTRWSSFQGAIEQRRIGCSKSVPLHFYQSNLRPFIRKFDPDVLYVEEEPYAISAWQAFYASRGLPVKRLVYSAQNIAKRYPVPFRWMEQYVLSHADAATVVSEEVGSALRDKGYYGTLISFPLGVDTNLFQPSEDARRAVRRQMRIDEDAFVIGYVGRFVEEKGIRLMMDALPQFDEMAVTVLFVGNGPLLPEILEAQQQHPSRVRVARSIKHSEVPQYMNALDVSLLPSLTKPNWKEQFGRVIVESMACRVPVIGSDSGEIPRLLSETGGGWIFREGNVEHLVDVVRAVLMNKQQRLLKSADGYRYVQSKYSKRALANVFSMAVETLNLTVI